MYLYYYYQAKAVTPKPATIDPISTPKVSIATYEHVQVPSWDTAYTVCTYVCMVLCIHVYIHTYIHAGMLICFFSKRVVVLCGMYL